MDVQSHHHVPEFSMFPTIRLIAAISITFAVLTPHFSTAQNKNAEPRPRARDLGIKVGPYETGRENAITDVPGVLVGHATLISGENIRTGVTAILPHSGNIYQEKVTAAVHVFNAFGKFVGSTQVNELGTLETPILLTNTLSVWDAAAALADFVVGQPGNANVRSINPVVGETNDGFLNDIRGRHVKAEHVRSALAGASGGPVAEGSVGAGTGTMAFGWKAGIGTASRIVPQRRGGAAASPGVSQKQPPFTVGVLVQSNFGGRLTISGIPVWQHISPESSPTASTVPDNSHGAFDSGSCIIVVATDAPLDHRQLRRLATRAILGFARTGASGSHGSGDYVLAFSTRTRLPNENVPTFEDNDLSILFSAVADATEEAIYNSLLRATTVRGRGGNTGYAIPIERLTQLLPPASRR